MRIQTWIGHGSAHTHAEAAEIAAEDADEQINGHAGIPAGQTVSHLSTSLVVRFEKNPRVYVATFTITAILG